MKSAFQDKISPRDRITGWARELGFYIHGRSPGKKPPRVRLMILSQGRSGSSLLCSLLHSHPQMTCLEELFAVPKLNPFRFADRMSRTATTPVFGFKAKSYQINSEPHSHNLRKLLCHMTFHGWQILYLRRENLFRQCLSNFFACQSGEYVSQDRKPQHAISPFTIPAERLTAMIREREMWLAVEKKALTGLPHISLSYEEHLMTRDKQEETCRHLFELLEIDSLPASSRLVPTTPRRWEDSLLNPEEIRTKMVEEGFEPYLQDPRYEEPLSHAIAP